MEWEHRNWYSFLWLCGDQIVEQYIHNIDFMNWVMGAHPEKVVASGGVAWRRKRGTVRQHLRPHELATSFTPTECICRADCRQYPNGTYRNVSDLIVGTKKRSNGLDLGTHGINPYVQEHIRNW